MPATPHTFNLVHKRRKVSQKERSRSLLDIPTGHSERGKSLFYFSLTPLHCSQLLLCVEFLTWAVGCLSVFCAITPNVNLLEIAKLWAHPSRAPIVHQNCSTGKASGKSANALLRSIFNEIRYALDKGQDNLARALVRN